MGCLKLSYYQTHKLKVISTKKVLTFKKSIKKARRYNELKDHLANVKTVISDEKLITDAGTPNVIDNNDNFTPNVLSYQDFFAFGAPMPGRQFNNGSYRFGFNGKENDNEVKGTGNQQDYGFRIYDPRLGKFLSVDPLTSRFPMLTPYQFSSNTPIAAIDLDGLEAKINTVIENAGKTKVNITIDVQVINKSKLDASTLFGEAFDIAKQIETSYSGFDAADNTEYIFKVNLTLGDMDDNGKYINPKVDPKSHFIIEIVDAVDPKSPNTIGRLIGDFGNTQKNTVKVKGKMSNRDVSKTGAHEVGHGLGLRHGKNAKSAPDPKGPKKLEKTNLMLQSAESPNGVDINNSQRKQIAEEVEKDTGKNPIYLEPKQINKIE